MPKKVDQFSHPQASCEAATIDSQGEQKLLLDFGPFAGEPSAEQLSPSEPGLFHAWLGGFLIVVVVGEGWRVAGCQRSRTSEHQKCVLESRASVFCFMEFLQLIEKLADHGKATCALVQMTLAFLDVMRLAGRVDSQLGRVHLALFSASRKPLAVVLGDESFLGEGRLLDRCEMRVPIDKVDFCCAPVAIAAAPFEEIFGCCGSLQMHGAVTGDCGGADLKFCFAQHDEVTCSLGFCNVQPIGCDDLQLFHSCELVVGHHCILMTFHVFPVDLKMERFDDRRETADHAAFEAESIAWKRGRGSVSGLGQCTTRQRSGWRRWRPAFLLF
jgi:hypothetical protein